MCSSVTLHQAPTRRTNFKSSTERADIIFFSTLTTKRQGSRVSFRLSKGVGRFSRATRLNDESERINPDFAYGGSLSKTRGPRTQVSSTSSTITFVWNALFLEKHAGRMRRQARRTLRVWRNTADPFPIVLYILLPAHFSTQVDIKHHGDAAR